MPGVGSIDPDEIVKGYEIEKGNYILLDEEEIAAVKLESKKTLELTQFVDAADIDVIYYEKPYYVVPADDLAEEAFIVLREALRQTKKVGLGQLALRGREYVVSLKPCGRGMVLETLRYADEVNKASSYFREIEDAEPDEELLDLAKLLITKREAKFDPGEYKDRYIDALKGLIEEKKRAHGAKVIQEDENEAPRKGGNVIDLMAALKKSLEKGGEEEAPAAKPKPKKAVPANDEKPPARRTRAPAKAAPQRKRA